VLQRMPKLVLRLLALWLRRIRHALV